MDIPSTLPSLIMHRLLPPALYSLLFVMSLRFLLLSSRVSALLQTFITCIPCPLSDSSSLSVSSLPSFLVHSPGSLRSAIQDSFWTAARPVGVCFRRKRKPKKDEALRNVIGADFSRMLTLWLLSHPLGHAPAHSHVTYKGLEVIFRGVHFNERFRVWLQWVPEAARWIFSL